MTEIRVYLGVSRFGDDPGVVTEFLGITPTAVRAPGALMPGAAGERGATWRHGRWELTSPAADVQDVAEQLTALLPLIEPHRDAIREAARRWDVELVCVAYFRDVNPGFNLDASLLARLSDLHIGFDFDLYCLGAPAEQADSAAPAS